MLFSSIDIGSNAVRLFFANVFEIKGKAVSEKASLIRIPLRLGEDVFNSGNISESKIENLIKTMKAFKLLLEVYKPLDYIVCATSAMREALNKEDVVNRIFKEAGIKIKIIDGEEEAHIVCAVNNITVSKKFNIRMYVDVGGGSTEISVVKDHKLVASSSFNIGTLRLLSDNFDKNEWVKMNTWFNGFKNDFGKIYLIGSGGNINKLSKMYSTQLDKSLSYPNLKQGYKHLSDYSLQQRIEQLGLRPDRADVIIPASEIFLNIMKITKSDYIFVPRIGLSDGLIYTLYKNYTSTNRAT